MISSGFDSSYGILCNAAGIAGNIFAFGLFISPIPTFRRIIRNRSIEQFSGLPYIYALLNCLITLWYGLPMITPGVILVATVNSIGATFQLIYVIIFIIYAENVKKVKMVGLLVVVFGVFAAIVFVSLRNIVIRTKSVEFMPFYLSLSTFLMSISFFAYGGLKRDVFIYVPNGVGTLLGIVQLALYAYYSRGSREVSREPLLPSCSR